MSLGEAELAVIDAVLSQRSASAGVVSELRQRLPGLKISQCDPSDLDLETPFRVWPGYAVHLVDGSAHCWRLTGDVSAATGLVLVAHEGGA